MYAQRSAYRPALTRLALRGAAAHAKMKAAVSAISAAKVKEGGGGE
jgi:hypothetical protein